MLHPVYMSGVARLDPGGSAAPKARKKEITKPSLWRRIIKKLKK